MYISQTKKLSQYLLLTISISSLGHFFAKFALNSIGPLRGPLQGFNDPPLGCFSGRFLSYSKKKY